MRHRYFSATAAAYEQARLQLDAAWNLAALGQTSIEPATSAPQIDGRIYLAVREEFCSYEPAATILADMLAAGDAVEVTAAEYFAALPPAQPEA